jgi:hypothetical protein
MDFQLNLFSWPDPGPHVIALAKGALNAEGVRRVFREVAQMTEAIPNSKVLIDVVRAEYSVDSDDIDNLVKTVESDPRLANAMIAIVSPCDTDDYGRWLKFSALLSCGRVNVAAFNSLKLAVDWLVIGSQ